MAEQIKRPIGVTIIAILTIIGGIILTFGGISLLAFGAFFTSVPIDVFISEQMQRQQEQLQLQQQQHTTTTYSKNCGMQQNYRP